MAIQRNQAIMVLHQEGRTTSTVPQTSACSLFVVVNQLHPSAGRQDKQTLFTSPEASTLAKPSIGSCVAGFNKVSSMSLSAMAATNTSNQLCNLPAESTCNGITVTLDNNNMWNEFFRCQTEMILTKQGRRMFPCCRFRISGLEPFQRYTLVMDMQPVDNYRYKWSDRRWEINGKADTHIFRYFVQPASPATGLDWMQGPVSFYKLKLTNNLLDREGHIIINSMHRYIPRLHIIPADKATDVIQLDGPDVITFSFSQTEFFAVTAYQNLSITQLKIDYNPFAKGFRDDANNSRCGKPKNAPSSEQLDSELKPNKEATALNNLKSLFAKINASEKATTNGDLKNVHCDGPKTVDPESSRSTIKRPWPGGLSELIKGAHVKVKRISPDKGHNDGSQPMNVDNLSSKKNNVDVPSKDCTSEIISIPDLPSEEKESFSIKSDSILKNTTENFCNTECKVNKTTSDTLLTETVATIMSETTTVTNEKLISEEGSKSVFKPLVCTEVKKKKAEPVPLPLLALFLQQLKSKTRPKPNSEACSLSLQANKASHDTEVVENLSFSAASFIPSPNTQLVTQSAASPKSSTTASSILTCTVARNGHETVITPDFSTDAIAAPIANLVHDTFPLSAPMNDVSVTTSEFLDKIILDTSVSDVTHDTKIVSVTLDDASSDHVASCEPETFPVTTPDVLDSELINDNATTNKCTTEPSCNSYTVPCPEPIPEVVQRVQSPRIETPSSPFCAISSPYMSAPSSPDPFPPSMFSDRPIPPRKTLELFPPCLLFDRQRPLFELSVPLTQRDFISVTTLEDPVPVVSGETAEASCPIISPDPCITRNLKQSPKTNKSTTYKVRKKKGGKAKLSEYPEVLDGSIPVPMQPNLEDVEGQLFVSFTSKKALEIHLGDEAKETILQKTTEDLKGEVHDEKESIDSLEKVLLRDLKNMKNRQVIHPVLQAVGLKLNLLDVALSIDLEYLGVCLPIPPPVLFPEGCSETCSSQVQFVSRTGKTTDITKIKGWREKFSATSPSPVPGVTTSSDTGQKNLSAFCSDMLDEYLESEGKLIDERAASFSQAVVTPVAYQLPTKSTSYVRTLDSVLKKQAPPLTPALFKPSAKSRKTALISKINETVPGVKTKKFVKSDTKDTVSIRDTKSGESPLKKKIKKSSMLKPMLSVPSAAPSLSQPKTSKMKSKKGSKISQGTLQSEEKPGVKKEHGSVAPVGHNTSGKPGPKLPVGRSPVPSKTLVKLRDVEDGAIWEGKHRTYITMERASIALSCFVTAEGTIGGSPSTVIKRRAPPCLNDFCRLGCVCASLVQERRQHHCGKPQCMLGCDCLRRKVVLLKNEETNEGSAPQNPAVGKVKKKKNRLSYVLSGPDAAPEPALHVKTLWNQKIDLDSERLHMPSPARPVSSQLASPDLQKDLKMSCQQATLKTVDGEGLITVNRQESLDCARVRSFSGRKQSFCRKNLRKESNPEPGSQESMQEIEEGELRPPTQSGPIKRLEILSKCEWETEGIRNVVLRKVCERMAQDRLKHPFWISKYKIQPSSKTIKETDEGTSITYKVVISQPHLEENEKKVERLKQLEAQLIETIGKSEIKGLPLLSQVTPAGVLKAEIKPPGGVAQIMVNGKPYPQARLELGQMGALHPANRLAAYITGRVCVVNKHDAKNVTNATDTSAALTTSASVATTTVMTSVPSSSVTLKKPTDGPCQVVQALPVSGSATPDKPFMLTTTGSNVALPPDSIKLLQTLMPVSPTVPGQRMMMFKAHNNSAQFIQLVPLSQLRDTNHNIVLRPQQSTFVHLPSPNPVPLSKCKTTTVVTSTIATFSATQAQNMGPLHITTMDTVMTSSSTFVATKSESLLSDSKTVLFCHKPSTVKIIPAFLGNCATNPLRIINTRTVEEPQIVKEHRNTPSSAQSTSRVHPANQCIQLTSQRCLTPKNQNTQTLDSPIHTSPTSAEQSCEEETPCSKSSRENVVFVDHSYTVEMKNWNPSPINISKDSSDFVNGSTCRMLHKEVLDLDFVEEVGSVRGAVQDTKNADKGKAGSHLMEDETDSTCSELTEDSDMYNDMDSSEFSEKEESHTVTDSEREDKNRDKQNSVDADIQNLSDELVDIETLEEGNEKCTAPPKQMQHDRFQYWSSYEENEIVPLLNNHSALLSPTFMPVSKRRTSVMIKLKKRKQAMKRRIHLGKCFHSLKQTLNIDYPKVSKITLLAKALKEINSLSKIRNDLVKIQDKLTKERADYIELASQLSGKNKDSISKELDDIIAEKKSPGIGYKANDSSLHLEKVVVEPLQQPVRKSGEETGTSDEAKLLNINKLKGLASQEQGTKCFNTDEKMTATKPTEPSKPSNSHLTPQLTYRPPIPISGERNWPNILSRSRSQTLAKDQVPVPEIIPVMEAALPWNQIITISNPLQPIDLTFLGERHSVTPGVAAVSISIPSMSYRLFEENPLPMVPPSVRYVASSAVNTPGAAVVPIQVACDTSAEKPQQNLSSDEATLVEEEKPVENLLPQVVSKGYEPDVKTGIDNNLKSQNEDERNTSQPEQDDDRLMSLLDELVFLNQSSEPQGASPNFTEAGDVLTELFTDKGVDMDDERSLSPLFLKLDEDIISSPTSKDEEMDDIPPKVDDLVKVIFGSESPPNSSESEIVPADSDHGSQISASHVKPDAPTPPPLLQMKTGGGNTADSSKEQAKLSWRPMPKLAPLGLKTQETGHTQLTSLQAAKSDLKLPSVHNVYL